MQFKDNLFGLIIIVLVFVSYHFLQPMGDGFLPLQSGDYSLKKHGLDNNKHAKFKDKKHGKYYIRPGVEDDVRGVFTFRSRGALTVSFSPYGAGGGTHLVLKHNDQLLPPVEVQRQKEKTIHLWVNQYDDLEVIAESDPETGFSRTKMLIKIQHDWFAVQNQLIPFLWAILFIFLWGKRHALIAANTYFIFLLMLGAQKLNFGALRFDETLAYLLFSFAMAFGFTLLYQLLTRLRRFKIATVFAIPLAIAVYIVPISFILYVWNFDAKVTKDILFAVFQSNGGEAVEYLFDFVALQYIGLFVFLAAVIGFLLHEQERKETKRIETSLLLLLTLTFFSISLTQTSNLTLPKFITDSFETYNHELKLFRNVQAKRKTGEITFSATKKSKGETYIIMIGESLNKKNMSLYGYVRDTTPRLSALKENDKLLVFENAYANYSYTIKVLQLSLTEANQYNGKDYYDSLSLIDVLKQAGVETYWLTNQVIYGGWDNMISVIANEADHLVALNHTVGKHTSTQQFDGALIDEVRKVLAEETGKNRVIFVHLMGNHGSYSSRYPDSFRKFDKPLPRSLFGGLASSSSSRQDKINHYDNSIVYNDDVVVNTIKVLQEQGGVAGLLYMPDHADDALAGKGHSSSKFNFHMLQIPLMVWLSDDYKALYVNKYATLQAHQTSLFSNDLFYDTVLGFVGVRTDRYDSTYDLVSKNYQLLPEQALTKHGKYKFTDKKNDIWWQKQNAQYLAEVDVLSRVVPHKINSIGKLKEIWKDGFRSLEMDVFFDEQNKVFRVGSRVQKLGSTLEEFLSQVPAHELKRIWIEFNHLNEKNAGAEYQRLQVLDKQFKLKGKLLIESDTPSLALKRFAGSDWQTTFYLPNKEIKAALKSGHEKDKQLLARKLLNQIKQKHVSGISFDGKIHTFIKQYLEPKLDKHIRYYTWYVAALKSPNFKADLLNDALYQDKRIDMMLSRYTSQYD